MEKNPKWQRVQRSICRSIVNKEVKYFKSGPSPFPLQASKDALSYVSSKGRRRGKTFFPLLHLGIGRAEVLLLFFATAKKKDLAICLLASS